jgi:uncharacterized protein YgbK (DUF1537 family)
VYLVTAQSRAVITVIADDLTGAAELAAAAANLGLSAEVHTTIPIQSHADVIALDTDTRSLNPSQAAQVVSDVARNVLSAGAQWLYKKTDSVLRGNVRAEIEALLAALGLERALLIPANPSKGRIIRSGVYYVNGVPLAKTAFARDPEHPRRSSRVADLLSATNIDVPDVERPDDLVRYAHQCDRALLPAGGVEFFEALLRARTPAQSQPRLDIYSPAGKGARLFVCGSVQAWHQGRQAQCDRHNVPVLTMPDALFSPAGESLAAALDDWAAGITAAVRKSGHAMAATGDDRQGACPSPATLVRRMADVVSRVLNSGEINSICLEGGATAAAVLRAMDWTRLQALRSDLLGVAVLRPHGLAAPTLLVKPGSYPWPDRVWPQKFF